MTYTNCATVGIDKAEEKLGAKIRQYKNRQSCHTMTKQCSIVGICARIMEIS